MTPAVWGGLAPCSTHRPGRRPDERALSPRGETDSEARGERNTEQAFDVRLCVKPHTTSHHEGPLTSC
eukprot:scaffold46793_cov63-Phaeocystis_antarctica.AAC.2